MNINRNMNATFFFFFTEITNENRHAKYITKLRRTVRGTGHAGRKERDYFMTVNPVILLFTKINTKNMCFTRTVPHRFSLQQT
jgi:hypothetical protein